MTTETEIVTLAEQMIATLHEKQKIASLRAVELADERGRIALSVHGDGDPKARVRLDKINTELSVLASEQASIESAIITANARLNVARAGEALAANKANALLLREKLERFKELGELLDDCFIDFRSAAIEIKEVLDDIHNLGCSNPTAQLFKVNCDLAFKTAVMGTPFWSQDFPVLGHGQKKTFRSLVESWSANIETNIARLGGDKPAEAA